MDTIVQEFHSDDLTKRAHIVHVTGAVDKLLVRCYEYEELVKSVNCTNHSLYFAEDVAENFVLGVPK